ncbi:MAG: RHS repeat domain-containing protein, partial [Blastocatellia bacterium]
NRLLSDSQNNSYTYDAAGNQTAGAGQSYSYDGANRLKTASGGTSSYGYDGDGKRVKKTESGTTVYYVGSTVLGQTAMEVTSASVQRAYVYNGNKVVAMQATDGQFYWLHTNHLGNSRAMTNSNGNLTYKGQFDPYGAALTEWSSSGNINLNSKKFTGYERDNSGLDYANARMYNSGRGRFMTPDPIGLKGANLEKPETFNRYSYGENDPINAIDPTGNDSISAIAWYIYNSLTIRDGVTVSAAINSYLEFMYSIFVGAGGSPVPWDEEDQTDRVNEFLGGVDWSSIELAAALAGGVQDALGALDRESCRTLFEGHLVGFSSAKDMLNTYMSNGLIEISDTYRQNGNQGSRVAFNDPSTGARTTYATGSFVNAAGTRVSANVIIVNSNGFYVSGTVNNIPVNTMQGQGFEGMNLQQIRGAIILHELLHAAGAIPSDGTTPGQSSANSELVRENCFAT